MAPTRTESYAPAEANQRLRQLGAQHMPQHSTRNRFVYRLPAHRLWATAEREAGGLVKLAFYAEQADGACPC